MSAVSILVTVSWWRMLLERLGRQAAQTIVPVLAAVVSQGGTIQPKTVILGLAGALAVTLGKALLLSILDVAPSGTESLTWRLVDRAVPAFAGVFAGIWPNAWAGLGAFDWTSTLYAAISAAGVAVLAVWVTPPALAARAAA